MRIRFIVAAAAALSLAACGGQSKPAAESSTSAMSSMSSASAPSSVSTTPAATSTSSAVASTPAAAPAVGEKPGREFLIGKWGTNGDCALAIDLRADGTSDGPFGNWTYNDGVIGFVDEPDFKVRVTVLDDNTMESTNDSSDKTSRMTRCP